MSCDMLIEGDREPLRTASAFRTEVQAHKANRAVIAKRFMVCSFYIS